MKKSASQNSLTHVFGGVIFLFLALQSGLVLAVRVLFIGRGIGWTEALLEGAVFSICLAGSFFYGRRLTGSMSPQLHHRSAAEAAAAYEASEGQAACQTDALTYLLQQATKRHRQTLQELKSANSFLTSIIRQSSDAIYVLDLEGRMKQINPAFEEIFGYASDEVLDKVLPIIPERLKGEALELIRRVQEGQPVSGYETVRLTKSGKEIHVSLTLSPILNEDGNMVALAAISRNITERKMTEELLRQSEKLSIIGQLAAGVAHEIRNPLTTLRGFVQLQQLRNTGNFAYLDLMLEELDRINLIVSEFIVLSKPHLNQFTFKDLRLLLSDLLRLLESQANLNNIMLDTRFDPELPKIKCEENQLKQVFLNIVRNSMEAMPEGGTVVLEARKLDEDRVLVRITDHGPGIPEEMLRRLGEPFLSSKENGTGLGLMVSRQIISNHQGQLVVRSELGKGTCVDIILPVDFEKCVQVSGYK